MTTHEKTLWSRVRTNITNRLLSGMLLLMPFGLTLLVMRWLFGWVAGLVRPIIVGLLRLLVLVPFIDSLPDSLTTSCVAALTIIILLAMIYLIGDIAQRMLGKKMLRAAEKLVQRIPLARSIYSATKQVIQSMSMPDKTTLKSVVLVEFPRPGYKAIGFLTGTIQESSGKKLCKVFIPTSPNPTTGFFELVPAEEVTKIALTVEEAFKMIISGGIVSPDVLSAVSLPVKPMQQDQRYQKRMSDSHKTDT